MAVPASVGGSGGNDATDSTGTVQVGGGNTASESLGSAQSAGPAAAPGVNSTTPSGTVAVSEPLAVGGIGGNSAGGSTGTVQVGGANEAAASTGTVQTGPVTLGPSGAPGGNGTPPTGAPDTRTLASVAGAGASPAATLPVSTGGATAPVRVQGLAGQSAAGRPTGEASALQSRLGPRVVGSVLPFTGIALALWALLGLASLLLGAGLRRSSVALG
jgi:hypothetical protein